MKIDLVLNICTCGFVGRLNEGLSESKTKLFFSSRMLVSLGFNLTKKQDKNIPQNCKNANQQFIYSPPKHTSHLRFTAEGTMR